MTDEGMPSKRVLPSDAVPDRNAGRPFFSIIVPVWNRAGTIRRCLDSVLAQDFQDYEIIVVDDGSVDDSVRVMEQVRDKRLRILRHEKNLGKNPARRTAADASRGRWIMQLDSDDTLMPGALNRMAEMTRSTAPDVGVIGLSVQYDVGGRSPQPPIPEGDIGFDVWLAWLEQAEKDDFLICRRPEVYRDVPVPTDGRGSNQMMLRTASRWKFHVDPSFGALYYTDATNRMTIDKAALLSREAKLAHAVMTEEILREFGPVLRRKAPRLFLRQYFAAGRWYFLAGRRARGAHFMLGYLARKPWAVDGWLSLGAGLLGPGAWLWLRRHRGRRA